MWNARGNDSKCRVPVFDLHAFEGQKGGFAKSIDAYKQQQKQKQTTQKKNERTIKMINEMSKRGSGSGQHAQRTFDYYNTMGARKPPKEYYEASKLLRGGSKNEKQAMKKYNSILKKVKKQFGHSGTTLDSELQQWCDKHIPNFTKVVAYDKMPSLKKTQSCIVNLDHSSKGGSHWVAVYKSKNGRDHIVYDSFGRSAKKILSKLDKGLKMTDTDRDAEQRASQMDCGQRCCAWLLFVHTNGIETAMLI